MERGTDESVCTEGALIVHTYGIFSDRWYDAATSSRISARDARNALRETQASLPYLHKAKAQSITS